MFIQQEEGSLEGKVTFADKLINQGSYLIVRLDFGSPIFLNIHEIN
jgi:hypothetical protein